jgi:hypothetical protein
MTRGQIVRAREGLDAAALHKVHRSPLYFRLFADVVHFCVIDRRCHRRLLRLQRNLLSRLAFTFRFVFLLRL